MKIVHPRVHCPHCPKDFPDNYHMNLHIRSIHLADEDKPHRCDLCGKGFATKFKVKEHVISVHTKEKPYVCKYVFTQTQNNYCCFIFIISFSFKIWMWLCLFQFLQSLQAHEKLPRPHTRKIRGYEIEQYAASTPAAALNTNREKLIPTP